MRNLWKKLLAAAMALAIATGLIVKKPNGLSATARVVQAAADTLVMTATWTNPINDGRGAIDSLRIRFQGIQLDTTFVYRTQPFPTTAAWKHVIPSGLGTAGFDVFVSAVTFRRGSNAVVINSPEIRINLTEVIPPNVTGLTATAVKRP